MPHDDDVEVYRQLHADRKKKARGCMCTNVNTLFESKEVRKEFSAILGLSCVQLRVLCPANTWHRSPFHIKLYIVGSDP